MGHVQVGYKIKGSKYDNNLSVTIKPISLTEQDVDDILSFFYSLEGRKATIEYPQLPRSTVNTPQPITDSL